MMCPNMKIDRLIDVSIELKMYGGGQERGTIVNVCFVFFARCAVYPCKFSGNWTGLTIEPDIDYFQLAF